MLGQEVLNPAVNWYTEAALPQNLPAPFTNINMGGLLAWEFLMMHFVEVRRWQDIRKHGSVNEVRARARARAAPWRGEGGRLQASGRRSLHVRGSSRPACAR